MAQLNSPALNALTAAIGGRSDPASGSVSNAPSEQKRFAEMMAGAIQNQNMNAQGRSSAGSKTAIKSQAAGSAAGQASQQQLVSSLKQQITTLQEKIKSLSSQNPPLSDKAQAALSALTQQLDLLKSQLEKGGGSPDLDEGTLTAWLAQLDKLHTLLQQGDNNAASWVGQIQAMAQDLNQMNGQNEQVLGRIGQTSTSSRLSQSAVTRDAQQMAHSGSITKDASVGSAQQGIDATLKDNFSKENFRIDNSSQSQNNSTVSDGRTPVTVVTGHIKSMSGAIDSALSAKILNAGAALSPHFKGLPKSDLVMQLSDPSSNNVTGVINQSSLGFGSGANIPSAVTPSGTLALNQPQMTADLGQNIQYMLGKNITRATLDVNPAHLGPLKILIDQKNNQTTIQIMASHHLAKDMLDQNMPRLRDWLQSAGLENAQVNVMGGGQDGANHQPMNGEGSQSFDNHAGGHGASAADVSTTAAQTGETNSTPSEHPPQTVNVRWRLDTFA